jgi:hypothetical protein
MRGVPADRSRPSRLDRKLSGHRTPKLKKRGTSVEGRGRGRSPVEEGKQTKDTMHRTSKTAKRVGLRSRRS